MASRSIWSGTINFGMITVPVKLYVATESKDIAFRQLHDKDHGRIKMPRTCSECEENVKWEDIVKGYEYSADNYLVMTDADFDDLPVPSKKIIEISQFVPANDIDPVLFEKSYFLAPTDAGKKAYELLMRGIKDKGLIAIGTIAIRNRESMCALRVHNSIITLETLFYPDEVRENPNTDGKAVTVTDDEVTLAYTLVDMLTGKFNPDNHQDAYREALMEHITSKLSGDGEVVVNTEPIKRMDHPTDIVAALRASIEAEEAKKKPAPAPRKRKTAVKK